MRNTFTFVGNIVPVKDSEKFKGYEEQTIISKSNGSKWNKKKLRFNMVCGDNRHLVESEAFVGDLNNSILKLKQQVNEDGKTKYENIDVKFKDRFKSEIVDSIAPFNKFTIDVGNLKKRNDISKVIDKIKSGEVTDEEMLALNVSNLEDAEALYKKSLDKKKVFISEWDFIDYIHNEILTDKYKDKKFKVTGDIVYENSQGKNYRKYKINSIYLTNDEITSEGTYCFYFGKDAVDDTDYDETGKMRVTGYLRDYDRATKSNFGIPMAMTIDSKYYDNEKKALAFKRRFTIPSDSDVEFKEIGLKCKILDGAQKTEINVNTLPEEVREDLEAGLITIEDVIKDLGGSVYGERVQDLIIDSFSRGYATTGPKDTIFTVKDFGDPRIEDVDEDIFDEDDDI